MGGTTFIQLLQTLEIVRKENKRLCEQNDRVIKERNSINHQLVKANEIIFQYQKWFKKHEHLVTPEAVHNSLDVILGNEV